MSYIVVDVEADGQIPGEFSIVCFGAVLIKSQNDRTPTNENFETFYGKIVPISEKWDPQALAVSSFSREEHLKFDDPVSVMTSFDEWLKLYSVGKPTFISDNPAFDWSFINWYFHKYIGRNPFGHSARRIGDLYCGMMKDVSLNHEWKRKYRKTKHDHNPVNDAIGNAEALLAFKQMGLKIKF